MSLTPDFSVEELMAALAAAGLCPIRQGGTVQLVALPRESSGPFSTSRVRSMCWCESCDMRANHGLRTRMSVCPTCGDKRCPRARMHTECCSKAMPAGSTPLREEL